MKRLLVLLIAILALTFAACAANPGRLTPESRKALEQLRAERIMCPIQLFTNCTLDADFTVEFTRDSIRHTFTGQLSTSNRCFNFSHGYIDKMFNEPVRITTDSDTTGYGGRLERWVKKPLDADLFLSVLSPRKRTYESVDAQLEYLGTENEESRYKIYYALMGKFPVECRYWCDLKTHCITRASVEVVLNDGSRISITTTLDPYTGIGRTSYPQDACYLKFARQIDYRLQKPDGTTQAIRLWNIRLEDIGVYKTGRKEDVH